MMMVMMVAVGLPAARKPLQVRHDGGDRRGHRRA
jgi:hypothetical protein